MLLIWIQMMIGNAAYHCSCVNYITSDNNTIIIIGVIVAVVLVIIIIVVVVVIIVRCHRQSNINKPSGQGVSFGPNAQMSIYPGNQSSKRLPVSDDQSEIEMTGKGGQYSSTLPYSPQIPSQDSALYSRQLPSSTKHPSQSTTA